MNEIEGGVGQAAVCGQLLGVQLSQSRVARLDLLAEKTPPSRQQAQLQPIAASLAGAQRGENGDEADKRQGYG